MAEFKNKEEYEKWKTEKQKHAQQKIVDADTGEPVKPASVTTNGPAVETKKSGKKKEFLFVTIGLVVLCPAMFFLLSYMTHGKVSGNIYAVMKSGDVKKAAGVTVYLLKADTPQAISAEVDRINNEYHNSILLIGKDLHGAEYLDESRRIETTYKKMLYKYFFSKKFQETQTDVNGSYDFQKIPYDKYMFLATFKVFDNSLDWLLPIEINKKETKIDLSNNNTTYISSLFHVE